MFNFHALEIIEKQRRNELEAEADNYRLIKESQNSMNTGLKINIAHMMDHPLSALGKALENLGRTLQKKPQAC